MKSSLKRATRLGPSYVEALQTYGKKSDMGKYRLKNMQRAGYSENSLIIVEFKSSFCGTSGARMHRMTVKVIQGKIIMLRLYAEFLCVKHLFKIFFALLLYFFC